LRQCSVLDVDRYAILILMCFKRQSALSTAVHRRYDCENPGEMDEMCIPLDMMSRPSELGKYAMTSRMIGSYISVTINRRQCGCLSRARGLCKSRNDYRHKADTVCAFLDICAYLKRNQIIWFVTLAPLLTRAD